MMVSVSNKAEPEACVSEPCRLSTTPFHGASRLLMWAYFSEVGPILASIFSRISPPPFDALFAIPWDLT